MTRGLSQVQHNTLLDIYAEPPHDHACLRANKVVCTIGPKTQPVEQLKTLIEAGMACVRNNFSHGTHEYHAKTIANARQAAKELGRSDIAIALDTKGPEIRTGNFPDGEVKLEKGDKIRVTTNKDYYNKGNKDMFYIDYTNITKVIKKGQLIFIDDGLLSLQVNEIGADFLDCEVVNAAPISSHKGVNLPNVDIDLPAVTEKDEADLKFGAEQNVDMVFASFIRTADQVRSVRKALGDKGLKSRPNGEHRVMIISKIENYEGVKNFDGILEESDGIMVARGDLGIEIPPEKVFKAQKMMISKCNLAGKPVICATQMLESMTYNPRPTRAEVSDVANAVLDGADCVMLSGETAKGNYPVVTVKTMANICLEAQYATQSSLMFTSIRNLQQNVEIEESIAASSVNSAFELQGRCIIVLTNSGKTARLISKYHPPCPIFAVTKNPTTARQLSITRACTSFLSSYSDESERNQRVEACINHLKSTKFLQPGHKVILVHADAVTSGFANQTRVIVI
ncbi:Pyruvate kinase [Diplonema papillatum]|nr:Pyruvate kinase [Diplonema papillatum]